MILTSGNVRKYNVYMSQTWNHERTFAELDVLLSGEGGISFIQHYVGENNPVHRSCNERQMYEAVKQKMKFCDVVLLLCGVYPAYSRWINKEIIACKDELNKPLIAVERYGNGRTSLIIREHADIIVGWGREEIIGAIMQVSPDTGHGDLRL